MADNLFHAYIVGGTHSDAKTHIDSLLAPFLSGVAHTPDHVVLNFVNFTIDNAHALRDWQRLTSAGGDKKIYVIYTDFITREAENALLKTFEEPVSGTHIIIAIPNPEVLLPTLLSRVRVLMPSVAKGVSYEAEKFLRMAPNLRIAHIAKIFEKGDDEQAAAEVRKRTLAFVNALEKELAEDTQKNSKALELVLKLKPYLYIPGSSARIILETLALAV